MKTSKIIALCVGMFLIGLLIGNYGRKPAVCNPGTVTRAERIEQMDYVTKLYQFNRVFNKSRGFEATEAKVDSLIAADRKRFNTEK